MEQKRKYLKDSHKTTTPRIIHPSIVMDHRNYIPTINITTVAFNANTISPLNAGIAQRDKISDDWSKTGYSASVLRQQQFRFDSKKDWNAPTQQAVSTGTDKRALGSNTSPKVVANTTIEKEAVLRQLIPNWF